MIKEITEAKDVSLYKKLIAILGDYGHRFPSTGVDGMFQNAVENGIKIMPKDKHALKILKWILDDESIPATVQKFLNTRFSALPIEIRPLIKNGRKKEVAFWDSNGKVGDKILDLINFEGSGKGTWVDARGDKTPLIDL